MTVCWSQLLKGIVRTHLARAWLPNRRRSLSENVSASDVIFTEFPSKDCTGLDICFTVCLLQSSTLFSCQGKGQSSIYYSWIREFRPWRRNCEQEVKQYMFKTDVVCHTKFCSFTYKEVFGSARKSRKLPNKARSSGKILGVWWSQQITILRILG